MSLKNTTPGDVLLDGFLIPLGISQYRLSKEIHLQQTAVSEIIRGKRAVSVPVALKLAKFLGTTPQFWLGLQAESDIRAERKVIAEDLKKIREFRKPPAKAEEKVVSPDNSTSQKNPPADLKPAQTPEPGQDERVTPAEIPDLKENEIYVFGSNRRGEHGYRQSAEIHEKLKRWGAKIGEPYSRQGNIYPIPYWDNYWQPERIPRLKMYIQDLQKYAREHPELTFYVSEVGCGKNESTPKDMAPMFRELRELPNVYLPRSFLDVLNRKSSK